MTSIFLAERWSRVRDTVSALNCQLASLAAQKRQKKICCVVLKASGEEIKNAADCGVELILPCLNEHIIDEYRKDEPCYRWLLSPHEYFSTLATLQNVEYIVEHVQPSTTSLCASALKNRCFKDADIVLINHGSPSADVRDTHMKFAETASAVFSVGPHLFEEYKKLYQSTKIEEKHKLYLPRPEKVFFDLDLDLISKASDLKQILTVITDKQVESKRFKVLSAAVGQTANGFEFMHAKIPRWFVRTSLTADLHDTTTFLTDNLKSKCIEPNTYPLYSSQDEIYRDLQQSNVLVIPPDEPFRMEGLWTIAAGLPVLVPRRTAMAEFLKKYFGDQAEYFLYEPNVDDLSNQISKMLNRTETVGVTKKLKDAFQSHVEINGSHGNFTAYFAKSHQPYPQPASVTAASLPPHRHSTDDGIGSIEDTFSQQSLSPQSVSPGSPVFSEEASTSQDQNAPVIARKRPLMPTLLCEANLELEDKKMKMETTHLMERERQQFELQKERDQHSFKIQKKGALLKEIKKLYELEKKKIMARDSPDLVKELDEAYNKFKAGLDEISDGSLQFMLSFLSEQDIDYFWQKYMAADVEHVISGILITPQMISLVEEAGRTARIRLKIDKKEYDLVKEILHDMSSEDESSDNIKCLIVDFIENTKPAFEFKVNSMSNLNVVVNLVKYHHTFTQHGNVMGRNNERVRLENITIVASNNFVCDNNVIETMVHTLSRLEFLKGLCLVGFNKTFIADFLKIQSKMKLELKIRSLGIRKNGLTINIVRILIQSIKYYPFLEEIDLSHNNLGAVGCTALLSLADDVQVIVEHNWIETGARGNEQHTTKVENEEDYLSLLKVDNLGQSKEKMARVTELKASALPSDVAKTLLTNISLFSGLKILNASDFIDDEDPDYVQSFCTGIGSLVFLERLFLRNNRIGDAGVESLSKSMEGMKNVRRLDISHNCISYVGARSVIGMLEKLTELEYVDLSKNNIGDVGAKTLSEIIGKLTKLTHLDLTDNSITNMGAISISNGLKGAVQLHNLYLGHNSIGRLAAESISSCFAVIKCIEILDLSYADLKDAGVGELSRGMKYMVGMIKLSLKNNNFGNQGAEELSKGMIYLKRLQHLDVCNNHIGSRGVAALCFGLQQCNKLTQLLLGHNRIGDDGIKHLSKHMVFLKDLEHFDISGNQIGDKGFKAVCKRLKHLEQLKHLDASQNVIADVGLKRLADNAHLLGNLQYLDLSHNAIEKTELVPLSQEMKYMKMLEKLDLSHNEMGTADASYLCKTLKDMKNLRCLQVEDAFKDIDIKVKEELYKEAKRLNVEIDDSSKNTKGTKEVNVSEPSNDERKAFVERQESFCSRTSTTSHVSSCSSRG